jgi:hypothetical protein
MTLDELKQSIGDPTSDEGFAALQEEAESQISAGYIADQIDLANYISRSLVGLGSSLAAKNPKRYDDLQKYFTLLSFAAFNGYSTQDKINLLQKRLLYAVQKGLDIEDFLKQSYDLYESEDFIRELFRGYAKYLEENTEQFGQLPIEVEGRRMQPQLKYWLLDYSKFPSLVAKRGPVERLNYVNQSPNTKALPQGQRETLLKILKLYDEFLNPNIPVRYSQASPYDNSSSESQSAADRSSSVIDQPYSMRAPAAPQFAPQAPTQPTPQPVANATTNDEALIRSKLDKLHERSGK